jgi:ATP-dependent Clp protease ATP-binding subunit ClpC
VGKSTLIRLLAQRIIFDEVPEPLREKKIKEINYVSLLTGSKYRGQFEEKVLKFFQEFRSQNAILVLEDIHLMIASGVARGTSLDLVNILKNFLRDNSIQVIATTDYEEYKNTLEKDNSLLGHFQKIFLGEMNVNDTREIIRNLAGILNAKDRVIVSDGLIDAIVESAKRNIRDRKLPDSAITLLERCVAKLKFKNNANGAGPVEMIESDLSEVLADILNVPEASIPVSLKTRLLNLKENVQKRIVGQDEAIESVASSIIASKLGFDIKKTRPNGVFLFIGPTGVGKTETAIALSEALYGSQDFLIRIDMSEYMERFTYSRFVGAAPGYVGYYDANQLTDKVRQNPYSVILLDEIEKADSQLLNIFLQVFDAGRLTDARGNVVDFSQTTVVMTSNIGTSLFSKANMGYQGNLNGTNVSRSTLIKSLKRFFSPEFLNRIDEIVVFRHLDTSAVRGIIQVQLRQLRKDLEKLGKELIITEDAVDFIAKQGYSLEYGARNLSRTLKKELLEKLAPLSLETEWEESRYVICAASGDSLDVSAEPAGSILPQDPFFEKESGSSSG